MATHRGLLTSMDSVDAGDGPGESALGSAQSSESLGVEEVADQDHVWVALNMQCVSPHVLLYM